MQNDTVLQLREELSDALEAKDEALGEKDDYRIELDKALDLIEELEDRIKNSASNSRERDESTTSGSSPRKMDRETRREVERLERNVEDLETVSLVFCSSTSDSHKKRYPSLELKIDDILPCRTT